MITGTETGNKRTGSIISLILVFAEMAEKIVPTVTNPKVPRIITKKRTGKSENILKLKNIIKKGSKTISNNNIKEKLLINFPRYIALLSTGARIMPSIALFSFSNEKD